MSCLVRTRGMASKSLADFGALLVAVTILGNASLHRPQPLDLKVRVCVCQYLHCKMRCSNPTLCVRVSSAAGPLLFLRLLFFW